MIGKANQKADEGVMISGPSEPDVGRRNLGAMLLAAIGAAGIAGCASATGEALESVGESAAALADVTIGWVDTVLGAFPSASRTGDLALYDGGNSYSQGAVVVVAKGCVTKGDGGGGLFYWETDIATPDDGGTVIVPNPTSRAGCWKRVYSGALNLAWFGASPTALGQDNLAAFINALKAVASHGRGTIQVSQMYPLGDATWTGISVGTIDNFTTVNPINGLTIEGTTVDAGFALMASITNAGALKSALKFTGCKQLTIRNLTLNGGASPNSPIAPVPIGFINLVECEESVIEGNRFINCARDEQPTFQSYSGKRNRFENNLFKNVCGVIIGYVSASNRHEEGAQFLGNTIVEPFENNSNPIFNGHNGVYVVIRKGVIANNCFRDMPRSIALLV